MTDLHITQATLEVLSSPAPDTRVTQVAVETLSLQLTDARLTQAVIELLSAITPTPVLLALARRAAGLDQALTFAQRPDGTNEIYSPRTLELGTDARVEISAPDDVYVNGAGVLTRLTGDVTAVGPGAAVATIAPHVVSYAKFVAATAAKRLVGRGASSAGDFQELTLGPTLDMTGSVLHVIAAPVHAPTHSAGGADPVTVTALAGYPGGVTFLRADATFATPPDTGLTQLTGDVVAGPGLGSQAATIANDAVTYAKLQNVAAASRLLGRGDSGAGDPQELTLGGGLTISGTTLNGARNSTLVNFTYNTSNAEPPSAGQVRTDTVYPWTATTKLWIRFVSTDNQDVYWGLMLLSTGSTVLMQDQDDHTLYGRFRVTGAPIDKGLYAEVPVAWTSNGGAILTASRILMQSTALSASPRTGTISVVIDGGGAVLTTGIKAYLEIPFGCTLQAATLLADISGSVVIDVWKAAYASYPPTVTNTITASAKPTITSALKSQDLTLTGWTTAVTAGDILAFNVDSVTTIKRVTLSLKIQAS